VRFPAFDPADRLLRDSEPLSDLPLKSCGGSDLSDLFVGQTAVPVGRASRLIATTFLLSVVGVVSIGARKQVCRIYAGRVIATMQNEQAVRDEAVDQFVTETMRKDHIPVHLEFPVAFTVGECGPDPAVVRPTSLNLDPEAFFGRLRDRRKRSGLPPLHVVALT
jgi:hypothetical protein